jgi:hypothetical protein
MTSTVAPLTNLTYKGTDLQDFPRIFLQISEGGPGASPEVRGDNRHVPYRRGQIYAPKRADRLAVSLTGFIAGEGTTENDQRSDTASARASLALLFDVEDGVGTLSVDTEDGTTWTCEAYPEVYLPEYQPAIPSFVNVSVRLVAIDPPEWTPGGS